MATDRYSDDHKIVVGNGNGLTIDAESLTENLVTTNINTVDYTVNASGAVILNYNSLDISAESEINISSLDNVSIISDGDISISSDNINITSSKIDIGSAEIKSTSSTKFYFTPIKRTAVSNSVFIPGVFFIPSSVSGTNLQWAVSSGYISAVANGSAFCSMPFIIPDGSEITQISMICDIDDPSQEIIVYLYKNSITTLLGANNIMATLTSNPATIGSVQYVYNTSISYSEVSYENNSYMLRLSMNYGSGTTMRLYGVKIFYSTNNIAA